MSLILNDKCAIFPSWRNNKIGFGIYYKKPFHKQKVFEDYNIKSSSFPEAEKLSKTILAIPIDPYLNMEENVVNNSILFSDKNTKPLIYNIPKNRFGIIEILVIILSLLHFFKFTYFLKYFTRKIKSFI